MSCTLKLHWDDHDSAHFGPLTLRVHAGYTGYRVWLYGEPGEGCVLVAKRSVPDARRKLDVQLAAEAAAFDWIREIAALGCEP